MPTNYWTNSISEPVTTFNETAATLSEAAATTWKAWVTTTKNLTAASTKVESVWLKWQECETKTNAIRQVPLKPPPKRSPRDEMIARNRRRSREVRQRNAARRARELLLDHLTPEQQAELEANSYFHVETADGRRRYRIARGHVGNIRVVRCDEPVRGKGGRLIQGGTRLCAHAYHPDGSIPDEDHMLAQKLLLESEDGEAELLQMANVLT